MAGFTEYLIDETTPADAYLHWDCNYVLDGGVLLLTEQVAAWCYSCSSIVGAEAIPSLDELDARICDLDNPDNLTLKAFGRGQLDQERIELPLRRSWRVSRESAARCLECGSTDIYPIVVNDCTEPRFRKRFRETGWGHASMCFEIVRRLSPEGLVIYTNDPAKRIKSHPT